MRARGARLVGALAGCAVGEGAVEMAVTAAFGEGAGRLMQPWAGLRAGRCRGGSAVGERASGAVIRE